MKIARTYSLLPEAQIAVSLLANRGIKACVLDDTVASIHPVIAYAAGIRVGVSDDDYSQARSILDDLAKGDIEEAKG